MNANFCQVFVMVMLHVTIPLGVIIAPVMKAILVKEVLEHVKVQHDQNT